MDTHHLFGSFPPHSRVWVYQSNRKFSGEEIDTLLTLGAHFIREWNTHGASVSGDFDVLFGCFVVIIADENQQMVSGCAIDRSVALIKEIERLTGANLFDRFSVAVFQQDTIQPISMDEFTEGYKTGKYNENTLVFNNSITTLHQLRNEWIVPVKDSWHLRFTGSRELSF